MATWVETLQQLRTDYVSEARTNLDEVARLVERLEQDPSPNALPDLARRFHGLAGSGFTYGFPDLTALGRRGERICKAVVERGGAPRAAELAEWYAVLHGLRRVLGLGSPAAGPAREVEIHSSGRPHALIVDDDATVRSILAALLESDGMCVSIADSREAAFRHLEGGVPDAMVVDVVLPDGLGYSLVEHVRGLSGGAAIPILMISVRAELDDLAQAVRCGADGFFDKPVAWEALCARLRQLLALRRPAPVSAFLTEKSTVGSFAVAS